MYYNKQVIVKEFRKGTPMLTLVLKYNIPIKALMAIIREEERRDYFFNF